MTFAKGWINRQINRMEQEKNQWPEWMQREVDRRVNAELSVMPDGRSTGEAAERPSLSPQLPVTEPR